MSTRDRILALRSADPTAYASEMARQLGVSRQWVSYVLAEEKLRTVTPRSFPHIACKRCGGVCRTATRRRVRLCSKCLPVWPRQTREEYLQKQRDWQRARYRSRHPLPPARPVRLCTIACCGRKHWARGLCRRHYLATWRLLGGGKTTGVWRGVVTLTPSAS